MTDDTNENSSASKARHTPGPWSYDDVGWKSAHRISCPQHNIAETIVIPAHGLDKMSISEANARLIAAAPDLLEALKLAHSFCGDVGLTSKHHPMDEITAAIDKAGGREGS